MAAIYFNAPEGGWGPCTPPRARWTCSHALIGRGVSGPDEALEALLLAPEGGDLNLVPPDEKRSLYTMVRTSWNPGGSFTVWRFTLVGKFLQPQSDVAEALRVLQIFRTAHPGKLPDVKVWDSVNKCHLDVAH